MRNKVSEVLVYIFSIIFHLSSGWDFLENTLGKGFKNTIPYPLPQPSSCGFEDLHAAEF